MYFFPDIEVLPFTQKNVELPFIPPEQLQSKEENTAIVLEFWTL